MESNILLEILNKTVSDTIMKLEQHLNKTVFTCKKQNFTLNYLSGPGAKPELLQAKLDLNEQQALKLQQLNNISNLKEQLNQLINVAPSTQYDVEDNIINNDEILLGEIMMASEKLNPQLLATKKNIDITRLTLKERQAEKYPVVSINSIEMVSIIFNHSIHQAWPAR